MIYRQYISLRITMSLQLQSVYISDHMNLHIHVILDIHRINEPHLFHSLFSFGDSTPKVFRNTSF